MTAATKRWSAPLPQVDLREMLRYAACRAPDEQTLALATQCAAEGEKVLRPALCWREVPLAVREDEVDLGFVRFGSRKLADALRGCERAVVFGATVGLDLDRLIARYGRISPSRGLMMQALGAERIEALCDAFCDWLAEEYAGSRRPVILDPGLTFGTGAHPSTQMVMETMENAVKPGWKCLDLGSGSGILSLVALRLGAASAVGIDIDPKAEGIARENAGYNGFAAPEFTALTGNVTEDKDLMDKLAAEEYDLVLVNIVADVIIGLAPILPNFLTEKSLLICSGILDVRLEEVIAALENAGLKIVSVKEKEDWRCVAAMANGHL